VDLSKAFDLPTDKQSAQSVITRTFVWVVLAATLIGFAGLYWTEIQPHSFNWETTTVTVAFLFTGSSLAFALVIFQAQAGSALAATARAVVGGELSDHERELMLRVALPQLTSAQLKKAEKRAKKAAKRVLKKKLPSVVQTGLVHAGVPLALSEVLHTYAPNNAPPQAVRAIRTAQKSGALPATESVLRVYGWVNSSTAADWVVTTGVPNSSVVTAWKLTARDVSAARKRPTKVSAKHSVNVDRY
jgi:hypothetical protein